jgi:hypothetical protein
MGILCGKVADNKLVGGGKCFAVWCYCIGGQCCLVVVAQVIVIFVIIYSSE